MREFFLVFDLEKNKINKKQQLSYVASAPTNTSLSRTSSAVSSESNSNNAAILNANTVNLLADLDMGGGDDYAYDEGVADDGDWGDKTIRVENKRVPPPPPNF